MSQNTKERKEKNNNNNNNGNKKYRTWLLISMLVCKSLVLIEIIDLWLHNRVMLTNLTEMYANLCVYFTRNCVLIRLFISLGIELLNSLSIWTIKGVLGISTISMITMTSGQGNAFKITGPTKGSFDVSFSLTQVVEQTVVLLMIWDAISSWSFMWCNVMCKRIDICLVMATKYPKCKENPYHANIFTGTKPNMWSFTV